MQTDSGLAHIVLDFDGTCTQIPPIFEAYLDYYRRGLNEAGLNVTTSEWRDAQAMVRQHSPEAGWTLAGCPSAPAAADPYVLADEAARLILRQQGATSPVPPTIHAHAYEVALAPFGEKKHSRRFRVSWSMAFNFILFRIPAQHSLPGDCAICLAMEIQWQPRSQCKVMRENSGYAN